MSLIPTGSVSLPRGSRKGEGLPEKLAEVLSPPAGGTASKPVASAPRGRRFIRPATAGSPGGVGLGEGIENKWDGDPIE